MSGYSSTNLQKHTNPNPVQRWLISRFHQAAASLIAQTDAHSLLDAGCGEGFAMQHLFRGNRIQVVGLDASVGALHLASQMNPQHRFVTGDVLSLPFPDNSVDLVLCMEVLEHLDDPDQGLRELCRVSCSWLLLSVPHEPFFQGANFLRGKNLRAWGNDPGHVNHWSARAFRRFVATRCQIVAGRLSFPWTLILCRVR